MTYLGDQIRERTEWEDDLHAMKPALIGGLIMATATAGAHTANKYFGVELPEGIEFLSPQEWGDLLVYAPATLAVFWTIGCLRMLYLKRATRLAQSN